MGARNFKRARQAKAKQEQAIQMRYAEIEAPAMVRAAPGVRRVLVTLPGERPRVFERCQPTADSIPDS